MKFQKAPSFQNDWDDLSAQHRALALGAVPAFNAACEAYVDNPGAPWPKGLRYGKVIDNPGVFEMTCNFGQPDIRATFEWTEVDGELAVRWRRIGDHRIFKNP